MSIPSNIAEGNDRISDKELTNFLHIALGSSAELETQLIICNRLGYFSDVDLQQIESKIIAVRKMINSLIQSTARKTKR